MKKTVLLNSSKMITPQEKAQHIGSNIGYLDSNNFRTKYGRKLR